MLRALGFLVVELVTITAAAQAPPTGLYEAWSPVAMRPVGPLTAPPASLPEWLSVTTTGNASVVVIEPERRIVWRVRFGPHGIASKRTEVDGALFSTSEFDYDASGHLVEKRVDGPGLVGAPWVTRFRTDRTRRVIERTESLALRNPWRSRNLPPGTATARATFRYSARGVVVELTVGGQLARRDTLDAGGRVLESVFFRSIRRGTGPVRDERVASIVYERDRTGALEHVTRVVGRRRTASTPAALVSDVGPELVGVFRGAFAERREVLLLLGAPRTHTDEGTGLGRTVTDNYSPDCWLNEPSTLEYDATGLLISAVAGCICGFCVDAALPIDAREVRGVDLHFTPGPWIRLDGAIDLTADHDVETDAGPRAAGELSPGDRVKTPDGSYRVLRSVERLPLGAPRLGRNVRTASGTFVAGGIVVRSEEPAPCAPAHGHVER